MDAQRRIVEAIATDGDRIAAVGSRAELMPWAERRGARVVELDGRAVVPGFIDAHGHFPGAGVYAVFADLNSPPIGAVDTIDDLVRILREQAQGTAAGEWVLGLGYDDTLLRERRHPTRADLDRVSTEHPVAASHVSGHLSVVNSRGLEALGFDASTPDPEGGVIRRDGHSGEPSGVLEETATEGLQALLVPSALGALRVVRRAGELYLAAGVTTAQSGFTNPAILSALTLASRIGLIPLRLVVWPDRVTAEEILSGELEPDPQDLWLRIGAVKLIADGSIQGYTGYLSEPYFEPPGDDPDFRGYPRIARAELIELVSRFHAAGLQVAVHGNGDASIDDILDAFEEAQRRVPRADTRPIVIHAQMAREDQLARMKPLGLIPSFFSLHTFYWGDRHRELFMGPERAARMSPARSAQRNGLRFTIHCDAPVVPMEPLRLVWSAVNRRTRSGAVVGADQRLTAMEALAAVTIDAAYQHFEDGIKGSLEAGKLADLVLLSRSPLEDPETIDEIRVLETVIGGRSAWRAADDG
jgi:predicted amidohydrolase YtcJ